MKCDVCTLTWSKLTHSRFVRGNTSLQCVCLFELQYKKGIPVEVIPMSYVPVLKKMENLGLKPVLRMAQAKAVSMHAS